MKEMLPLIIAFYILLLLIFIPNIVGNYFPSLELIYILGPSIVVVSSVWYLINRLERRIDFLFENSNYLADMGIKKLRIDPSNKLFNIIQKMEMGTIVFLQIDFTQINIQSRYLIDEITRQIDSKKSKILITGYAKINSNKEDKERDYENKDFLRSLNIITRRIPEIQVKYFGEAGPTLVLLNRNSLLIVYKFDVGEDILLGLEVDRFSNLGIKYEKSFNQKWELSEIYNISQQDHEI